MIPCLLVSALQNLTSRLLLVKVDLKSAFFLFDLSILHLNLVLKFLLAIFEGV